MKTRLQYIVKNEGLTNQRFAAEIGISPAAVTHILSGRNNPSLEIIAKIANRYPNYSLRWLILGELPIQTVEPQNEAINSPSAPSAAPAESTASIIDNNVHTLPFQDAAQAEPTPFHKEPYIEPVATPGTQASSHSSALMEDSPKSTAVDRLVVCFPDGTFKEFSRQQ